MYMSRGQTLILLPYNDNKLQKQKLAISSTPNSVKLGIGDGKFLFIFFLYMEVRVMFDHIISIYIK